MKLLAKAPLNLLRAFEAAGRTGAFALAASELELSPSAISHAIRKLENLLDVRLFQRSTREITLTKEGEILLEHIQRGFNELQQGLALVTADESVPLRLHTAPSLPINGFYHVLVSSYVRTQASICDFQPAQNMHVLNRMILISI